MTEGSFRYLDRATLIPGQKPWSKVDIDASSFQRLPVKKTVHNIGGHEAEFISVDTAGFAVYNSPSAVPPEAFFGKDDSRVRSEYYKEIEDLVKAKQPGVKKVLIFDHTIRKRDKGAARQPVQQVHVDQTPKAAEVRVRRHVQDPDEAESLLKGRYQIINVWRPIGHPASDFPLAVVDWRTTSPSDLMAVDLLYPKQVANDVDDRGKEVRPAEDSAQSTEGYEVKGETYAVLNNDGHKFWYFKDMTPENVYFIKCFDSRSEGQPGGRQGVAALTPHTAFEDPATPPEAPSRQSIEVRCLVFYDD